MFEVGLQWFPWKESLEAGSEGRFWIALALAMIDDFVNYFTINYYVS